MGFGEVRVRIGHMLEDLSGENGIKAGVFDVHPGAVDLEVGALSGQVSSHIPIKSSKQ
jgi:hypothetical protein